MKSSFTQQAEEVNRLRKLVLGCDQEVLREAVTSLQALAIFGDYRVLQAANIRKIAQELIMEVLTDGRELSQPEIFTYANDLNKILNEKASS